LSSQGELSFVELVHCLVQGINNFVCEFNCDINFFKCTYDCPLVCSVVSFDVILFLVLQADATLVMEQRHFVRASLEYVFLLQEVQERKKFEFVETVSICYLQRCLLHSEQLLLSFTTFELDLIDFYTLSLSFITIVPVL
jgi:hypothetical protein